MQTTLSKKAIRNHTILTIAFLAAFFSTIKWTVISWWEQHGTYGLVFLGISFYLVWTRRNKLRELTAEPQIPWGTGVLLAGCVVLIAGRLGGVYEIQFLSLVIALLGMVVLLGGINYLKLLGLPIICLIFTIPMFTGLLEDLSAFMQSASAMIAGSLLNAVGIPLFRSGQFLEFPGITLEVASVCSGANHVVALEGLALLIANWDPMSWLKKGVLYVSAFLLALVINGIRVAILGVMAYRAPHEPVHGKYEVFGFSLIFYIGALILLWISRLLRERQPNGRDGHTITVPTVLYSAAGRRFEAFKPVIIAAVILGVTSGYLFMFRTAPAYLEVPLSSLPTTIGTWVGRDASLSTPPFDKYMTETELRRIYRDDRNHEMKLYIGYFAFQQGDEGSVKYLGPLERGAAGMTIPLDAGSMDIRQKTVQMGGGTERIYFYYSINGEIKTNSYSARFATLLNALLNRRTNAAVIVVSASLGTDSAEEENFRIDFVKKLIPLIHEQLRV